MSFDKGGLTDYVDLKNGFDSVHRGTVWDLLRLREIPAKIIYWPINWPIIADLG